MNLIATAATTIAIAAASITGCQPRSDTFQPGIPVVENAPIPVWGPNDTDAPLPCVVTRREAAPAVEVPDGCRLDITMNAGVVDGLTAEQRCVNMGGRFSARPANRPNCRGVDY
jgi:hypothetical protein